MAIQRARDESRRRRFANAARPGKKICVMQAIVGDRILQRLSQDFLAGYVFKFLRAPLTGDYLIGHLVCSQFVACAGLANSGLGNLLRSFQAMIKLPSLSLRKTRNATSTSDVP